jgi:hypothetical protein
LQDILMADFPGPPLSPDSDQFRAVRLLYELNNFAATLKVSADRVQWMLTNNTQLGWLDLKQLKYQVNPSIPVITFDTWSAFQDVMYLIKNYPDVVNPIDPATPLTVYGIFDLYLSGSASESDILTYFATLTGLDATVVADLVVLFGYNHDSYKIAGTFRQLEECAVLLRILGVSVSVGKTLIKATLELDDATTLCQVLKAHYSDDNWLGVLKTIQDPLCRQKRDALVNYLLAVNPDFQTADDLYDYYLIDVQMGACMETSRVVQAHATIQLFVQRCLLGLEIYSVASEDIDS